MADYQSISIRIAQLVKYALNEGLIEKEDVIYSTNSLMGILGVPEYVAPETDAEDAPLEEILNELCDYAYENGLIENNSVVYRDLFDTKLMGALTPRPSEVVKNFSSSIKTIFLITWSKLTIFGYCTFIILITSTTNK